ncbi:MAG: NAD(P)H-hydrate dehydratase [Ignavibacteriae bacterium]|nr:NAD(P)H-hydrate dehydratase [Ignavibacteriota bacterium]
MKSIFYNSEVLDAEKKIITNLNIPSILLMENAGLNSADYIYALIMKKQFSSVIILAGKGNNAGDGFVIARHLATRGVEVNVFLLYPENELKGDAKINFDVIKNLRNNIRIENSDNLSTVLKENKGRELLIIDSVFGIGFKGQLDSHVRQIFGKLNRLKNKTVVAVDTVSGLESHYSENELLFADYTLSMGIKKFNSVFGTGREASGKNAVMNIGIPSGEFDKYNIRKIFEIEKKDIIGFIPKRKINSNKYTNGKLFALCGSVGFTGAAYLSSLSALKSGCGAVILGIPKSLNRIMESKTTEVITLPLPETEEKSFSGAGYKKILEKIDWCDALLIGPGIGRNPETLALVRRIISETEKPVVLDADGIFAFKDNIHHLENRKCELVLTPHYGEFSNLTGYKTDDIKKNIFELSVDFARKCKLTLVLKNSPTVITDGEMFYINSTGRENLATVGSGDVLSGIISGILARTKSASKSSVAGVYIHGRCGDLLFDRSGSSSTVASELIQEIQNVKKEL